MVVRISDKTQNYSKVTKLLVKPNSIPPFLLLYHYQKVHFLTVYCITSIISDNAYFFNTRGIFSRFSNHNLLLRLMVFPDS